MSGAARVIRQATAAHQRGDWAAFGELLHPDGVFCTIPSGERPAGPAETTELFRQAHADPLYRYINFAITEIDEHAGLTVASIRRRREPGQGVVDAQRVTLITVADGLLFRIMGVPSEEAARAVYRKRGLTLGL